MKQIVSLIFGIILFLGSFVVLWLNEGNSAQKLAIAAYSSKNAIPIDCENINKDDDGNLISTSGNVITDAVLGDENVQIEDSLIVSRRVEMYQWVENHDNSVTTYEKEWSDDFIDSENFEKKSYKNPSFPVKSEVYSAEFAKLGQFTLNNDQILLIETETDITDLPSNPKYSIVNGKYYSGNDINNPEIGDILISYSYVPSGTAVSVIGQQNSDNTISAYPYKNMDIYIQYDGNLSQDEIISAYRQDNSNFTLFVRIAGFLLMFLGLKLFISPIVDIFNLIPILGKIADFLLTIVLLLISLSLSLITIALAWFAYRPMLSVAIAVVVVLITIIIKKIIDNAKNEDLNQQ